MPLPETYSDPAISGGGQAVTQITHAMGMVHWVTGARTEEVFAYMTNRDLAVDVIDAISFRFEGGALGTMASTGTLKPHQVQPQELRYCGTEGYMLQEIWSGKLTIVRNDGTNETPDDLTKDEVYPAGAPSSGLVDLVLGLAGNRAPAEAGAATVEFLELAYLSAREHQPVRRDELEGHETWQ
jgi:predicted dehydrogenase